LTRKNTPNDSSDEFKQFYEEGRRLLHFGDLNESLDQFSRALKIDTQNAGAWFRLGIAHAMTGDFNESLKILEASSSREQHNPSILEALGHIYLLARRFADTERVLKEALKIKPDRYVMLYHLSSILFLSTRFSEAEEYARKATEKMPHHEDSWLVLGAAMIRQGKTKEGEQALDEVRFAKNAKPEADIQFFINSPQKHLVKVMMEQKNQPIDPKLKQIMVQQVRPVLLELELEDYSEKVSQKLTEKPVTAEDWQERGILLMNIFRYRDAELAFRKLLQSGGDKHSYVFLITALNSQLRFEDAVDETKKVYDANPDDKLILFAYYGTLCRAGRFKEADEILAQVQKTDPDSLHMFRMIWDQHRKNAEFEKIENVVNKLKAKQLVVGEKLEKNQTTWSMKGLVIPKSKHCWIRIIGHSEQTFSGTQITVSIDGQEIWRENILHSFRRLVDIEQIESGKRDIEIVMEIIEGNWFITAQLLYEPQSKTQKTSKRKTPSASVQPTVAVDKNHPTMNSADFWHEYGKTLMHLGKLQTAKEFLLRSTNIKSEESEAWISLGITHVLLAESDDAEKAFQRAVKENPDNQFGLIMLGLFAIKNNLTKIKEQLLTNEELRKPQYSHAWCWWACGYFYNCEFKEAESAARQAIAQKPNYIEAWLILGCALYRQDRQEEAQQAFQRFKSLYSDGHDLDLGKLAEMAQLDKNGKPKIVKPHPQFAKLVEMINPDFLALDNLSEKRVSGSSYFGFPENHEMWSIRGASLRTVRRFVEAEHAFGKVLEKDPGEPEPLNLIQELPADLRSAFQDKTKHLSGMAMILNERFLLLSKDGRQADAMASMFQADMLSPGTFLGKWSDVGTIDMKTGKIKIKKNPTKPTSGSSKVVPEKKAPKAPKPISESRKDTREKKKPEPKRADVKDVSKLNKFKEVMNYANTHLKQGSYSVAEGAFRRAIELKENNPEAWKGLSVSLMNQKRYNDGINALRKSKSLE